VAAVAKGVTTVVVVPKNGGEIAWRRGRRHP